MRLKTTVLAICALGALAASATAEDLGGVSIHGFLSQGYLKSSANDYAGATTSKGTFAFSEAAVNFSTEPASNLRIGVQLFARDLGVQGNHVVTVDWAVGDYRVRDWLGLRVGRIKNPLGLYNTLRDVDLARAEILQPQALYSIGQRDLLAAFDGGSAYGNVLLGRGGAIDYEVFGGTQNIDDLYAVDRFTRDGALASLSRLSAIGLKNPSYAVGTDVSATMDHLYGVWVAWRTPVEGLRLATSFQSSSSRFSSDVTYSGTLGPAPVSLPTHSDTRYEIPNACVGSLEYARGGLKLAAEYYRATNEITPTITGLPGGAQTSTRTDHEEAWYVQGSYRFSRYFQAQAYYSSYWPNREDKSGTRYAAQGLEYRAWTKDLAVTGRADINDHWLVKLEFHRNDGASNISPSENPGGIQKDWNLFAAKATFYF